MPQELVSIIGSNCEAYGHPTECTEPVPGNVQKTKQSSVSINGTEVYVKNKADMHYDTHSHDYTSAKGCHQDSSHNIDPNNTHSVTVNGKPVYLVTDKTNDPVTGKKAEIIDTGNSSVTVTK